MKTPPSGSSPIPFNHKRGTDPSEPAAPSNTQPLDAKIRSVTVPIIQNEPSSALSSPLTRPSNITSNAAEAGSENFLVASMSMTAFVNSLNDEPLKTYKSLLDGVVLHGTDFPFRPYREVLETTQKYLEQRADYSYSKTAKRLYQRIDAELKKNPEPGFSSTTKLLYELVHIYPESSKSENGDYEEKNPKYEEFEAIRLRKGEDLVIFSFITQNDLDLMFFVNARSVPVYALGLAEGVDLLPPLYDEVKNPTRKDFFLHDKIHMKILENRCKADANGRVEYYTEGINELEELIKSDNPRSLKFYISIYSDHEKVEDPKKQKEILEEIVENRKYNLNVLKNLLASMPDKTPVVANSLRLQRFNKKLREASPELQKPLEALAFFIFHEDSGGSNIVDPVFINARFLLTHIIDSNEKIEFSTINQIVFGIRSTVDNCSKVLEERLRGTFSYPPEYKTEEVISRLPQAAEWMFNFLNEERLYQISEAGRREENSPEQQELYALMEKAAQKIK